MMGLPLERIITQEMCTDLIRRINDFCTGDGNVSVNIAGWWNGELQWARNRVWIATDRRDIRISIQRGIQGGHGVVSVNQLDDASLKAAVAAAERVAHRTASQARSEMLPPPPELPNPTPTIWSDATYNVTASTREELARTLMQGAEDVGLLSAGYLEMRAGAYSVSGGSSGSEAWDDAQQKLSILHGSPNVQSTYVTYTQAQCSMTVRHPKGLGSGWAGLSGYNWGKIDGKALSDRALQKCISSLNPVKIEPGRYTVILEPQAMCDLLEPMMINFARDKAETGFGPWVQSFDESLGIWRSKLGAKVVDERITISHDPMDPELGILAWRGLTSLTWIDSGVLKTLEFQRTKYALPMLNEATDASRRPAFRMSGGNSSIDEMIQSTKRGLLITRLSDVLLLDRESLISTGVTRDGLWLIENGQISKSVQNMRFTESPLFVLNQIEELGIPTPVFRPMTGAYQIGLRPAVVPAVKANDFSFTSLNDAI